MNPLHLPVLISAPELADVPDDEPSASPLRHRPTGVTILGILQYVAGALVVVGGILGGLGAALVIIGSGGWIAIFLGLGLALVGVLVMYLGRCTLAGTPWAWTAGLVLAVLSGVLGLLALLRSPGSGVVTVLVAGVILWYLYTPEVKAWFRKEHVRTPWRGRGGRTGS